MAEWSSREIAMETALLQKEGVQRDLQKQVEVLTIRHTEAQSQVRQRRDNVILFLRIGSFLDATTHLYKRVCPSVRPSITPFPKPPNTSSKSKSHPLTYIHTRTHTHTHAHTLKLAFART